MDQGFIERVTAIVKQSREAETRLKQLTAGVTGQGKMYVQALAHYLNISGATRTRDIINSPKRAVEFGEHVWRLEKAVRAQPRLRGGNSGVRFWLTWHEAEQEWRVTFTHSVLVGDDGRTYQTRTLLVVKGENLPTALDRALAAVPTLQRPGYS